MKIAIIQLSDIHLSSEKDWIISRARHFIAASKGVVNECQKVIFVISGDIANTGQEKEYQSALIFLHSLEDGLRVENDRLEKFEYIIVPGNHDCYLPEEGDPVRDALIPTVRDKDEINKPQILDVFLSAQKNYWDFYSQITGDTSIPFVSKSCRINVDDGFALDFHMYNSSLLSLRNEVVGSLLIPENLFLKRTDLNSNTYVVSVFHHNTGWLSSSTPRNNKKRFEANLLRESNMIMCGHEHDSSTRLMSELSGSNSVVYLEGGAFQNNYASSFNILEIDSEEQSLVCHRFNYKSFADAPQNNRYEETQDEPINLAKKRSGLLLQDSFEDELLRFNLPIKVKNKPDLTLKDIYVFPDLDPILDNIDTYGQYIDSSELAERTFEGRTVILEGETQSGKSCLLNMLYLMKFKQGRFPLYIKGVDIKTEHTAAILEKAYKIQYDFKRTPYEIYRQLSKEDKILFIDNFDKSCLNDEYRKILISNLEKHFGTLIITMKDDVDLHCVNYSGKPNESVSRYRISSLGSLKRNELIEKWVRVNSDPRKINQEYVESQVKILFDQLDNLLGEQFVTPYPVFVLSMLQSLSCTLESFQIEQTYYAYCYNSLILYSIQSTGVDPDTQKEFLNFLTEFAYHLFNNKIYYFKKTQAESFLNDYKENNIYKSTLDKTLSKLCKANILREYESGVYCFSYKYIYYYLIAQKISRFIHEKKGKDLVYDLCSEIYNEESANILIFLAYHTRDNDLIETLLLTNMTTFDKYEPLTLNDDDGFMKKVTSLINNVKRNILLTDVDPNKERRDSLSQQDRHRRAIPRKSLDEERKELEEIKSDANLRDVVQTFRSIRILGQIIKNQKHDIGKANISKILKESYLSCFRMINFYCHYLEKEEDNIIRAVLENNKENLRLTSEMVRDRVEKVLSSLLYRICLGAFSTLSLSVGTQNMDEEFDQVASEIGTPAAKLVSFTIKSFYGPLKLSELSELVKEFEGNHLATHILKSRVLKYVYNNTITYQQKQQIGEICNLRLMNSALLGHSK